MISEQFKKAGDYIKANCTADDFHFAIYETDYLGTRFAQNAITQHISGLSCYVAITVSFGNKSGSSSVNQLDEQSLAKMLKTAESIAAVNEDDPEHIPTEGMHELPIGTNYYENIANLEVSQVVDNIEKGIAFAKNLQAKLSGITEKSVTRSYILTKNGFEGGDRSTSFEHSMTLKKDSVETKVEKSVINYDLFSIDAEIARLNSQFVSLSAPQKIVPGKYPVILRPQAVLNLIGWYFWYMDMRNSDEGLTPLSGQLGKQVFGEKLNLKSVINDKELFTPRFNYNGLPSRAIDWVKNGVLENMQVSRYYGNLKNIEPNSVHNIYISGGDTTEAEMMKMVPSGLIINNFWYLRSVDYKKGEITGMTRDGVLYFENGEVKHSTVNLRFNEMPIDVTRKILALGLEALASSGSKVPTILIDDFNFVDVTDF